MPITTFDDYARAIRWSRRWSWILRWLSRRVEVTTTGEEEQKFERQSLAMISSMTAEERIHPEAIDRHRAKRIADGSGTNPNDVKEFARAFLFMRDRAMGHGGSGGPSCSSYT